MSGFSLNRADVIVIGGGVSGLVAAATLAKAGRRVTVLEAAPVIGGALREVEFVPGFRGSPLDPDAGWIPPEVAKLLGGPLPPAPTRAPTAASALGNGQFIEIGADVRGTAENLRRHSTRDADQWGAFTTKVGRFAAVLERLYRMPAPRIDADTVAELFALFQAGRAIKGLGKREMMELLRVLPMAVAELLDEFFDSDALKGMLAADAVMDLAQGPISGATSFALIHRHVGAGRSGVMGRGLPGDVGALLTQLQGAVTTAGVKVVTNARVARLVVTDDAVSGVVLANGDEWQATSVVSSAGPYRTLLELLDPVHLAPDFIHAVGNVRFRGVATKVLVALDQLPQVPGEGRATLSIAPSVRFVEKAYDAVKYGEASATPFIQVRFPSVERPSLASGGKHVAVIHVQYTPYRLRQGNWEERREAIGDQALSLVDDAVPGFSTRVVGRKVYTPWDIEREFGYREGAPSQGELMLDQILFMRPVAGWSHYRMPVEGLFLTGAGTHPGPGGEGASGWLAAQAVLKG